MMERTRERHLDEYEQFMAFWRDHVERNRNGLKVLRGDQLPWNHHRHAIVKYYLTPWMSEPALSDWTVFIQGIKTQNGKHRHQGGLALFILDGRGYTVVNGERFDWEAGDLVLLPVMPEFCEHQHFNLNPDGPSKFLAIIFVPYQRIMGGEFVQVENRAGYEEELEAGLAGHRMDL